MVEVVKSSFSLKREFMKSIEHIKGECCLRAITCHWKPAGSHDLRPFMDYAIGSAVAKVNRDVVDTRGIDDHEIWWSRLGRRTGSATMTELDLKTKFLESCLLEK